MNNKVPPPIYFIAAAVIMYVLDSKGLGLAFDLPYAAKIASVVAAIAASIIAAAIISFRRASTTVDPLHPDAASALVQSGVFRWSRNPMYVGLTGMLLAGAVYLQSAAGFVISLLFATVITMWQIKPEEQALRELFGAAYADYCKRVRRWV